MNPRSSIPSAAIAALLVLCSSLICVTCNYAPRVDPCPAAAQPFGQLAAGAITTACQKCNYVRNFDDCRDCTDAALQLGNVGISDSDRVSAVQQCLAYLVLFPTISTNRGVACMKAAANFPAQFFSSYAFCESCAYSYANFGSREPTFCYRLFSMAQTADLAAQAVVRDTGMEDNAVAAYSLPPLAYATDALEPNFDNRTMFLHHNLHHNASVNALNAALKNVRSNTFRRMTLATVLASLTKDAAVPPDMVTVIRNNGGSHWNHAFFWTVLAPLGSTTMSSNLANIFAANFGSVAAMQTAFNAAANGRFGSGWAWIVFDPTCTPTTQPACKQLLITSTPNQDNPLMKNLVEVPGIPILGLDMWEHSYYLKNQNRRADYLTAFWPIINWDNVEKYLNNAMAGKPFDLSPAIIASM